MSTYRLCLRRDGILVGDQHFAADDAMNARVVAAIIVEACGKDCDSYQLWDNAERIDTSRPAAIRGVTDRWQEQVIATEESILGSKGAIARSGQLLARFNALKTARG